MPVRTARHLVCPSCLAHVRLTRALAPAACPHCQAPLSASGAGTPVERAARHAGTRGGVLLAALFGVSACGSPQPTAAEPPATTDEAQPLPEPGAWDGSGEGSGEPPITIMPLYGLAVDPDIGPPVEPQPPRPEPQPVPLYGVPPDR